MSTIVFIFGAGSKPELLNVSLRMVVLSTKVQQSVIFSISGRSAKCDRVTQEYILGTTSDVVTQPDRRRKFDIATETESGAIEIYLG